MDDAEIVVSGCKRYKGFKLVASQCGDTDYPGIAIDLVHPDGEIKQVTIVELDSNKPKVRVHIADSPDRGQ